MNKVSVIMLACALLVITTSSYAWADDAVESPKGSAFVSIETVKYFGIDDGNLTMNTIHDREDIAIHRVIAKGYDIATRVATLTRTEHTIGQEEEPRRQNESITFANRTYHVLKGEISNFRPGVDVAFVSELPRVGFEFFFLPIDPKTSAVSGARDLTTPEEFKPPLTGGLTFTRTGQLPTGTTLKSSWILSSSDSDIRMAGNSITEVGGTPMTFGRTHGTVIITIKPAMWFLGARPDNLPRQAMLQLKRYSSFVGRYEYSLMPLDSPQGKQVEIPQKLRDAAVRGEILTPVQGGVEMSPD